MLKRFTNFNLCAGSALPGGSSPQSHCAVRWFQIAAIAIGLFIYSATVRAQSYAVSDPVILQDFDSSYLSIENKMPDIFESGYGAVYLPPPGYSTTTNSVGYDVYNRFDLGTAQQPTTYGTQAEFQSVVQGVHTFGGKAYADLLWNDTASMDNNTTGFAASGGYPGLAVVLQNTNPNAPGYNTLGYNETGTTGGATYTDNGTTYHYVGDFHDPTEPSNGTDGQVAGLDDIAQEENNVLIRQPTTAGNPENIPAGTTPWNGYLANVPNAANAQYYPDLSLTPKTVHDAALNQNFTIYPYNTASPMTGTPVAENATGYLMRYTQWMVQEMGVDGFRIDAALNMPTYVLNYYDAAVYDSSDRKLLNGNQEQIYGYSEIYYGSTSTDQAYINLSDTNGGAGSTVEGNRDAMDFPFYQAMYNNLNAFNGTYGNSSGNNWYNVVNSSLDYSDDGTLNGSEGVKFVNDQDGGVPAPGLVQVAYAYSLMLPGEQEVYFNGQNINNESGSGSSGYFPEGGASDPKDSAMGALGGAYDTNVQNSTYSNQDITNLVDLRKRYGRGNYREDWIETNLLAYERTGSALVLLDNATSIDMTLPAGTDVESRTMSVSFAPGTWLEELTGNATSSYTDPNGEISEFLQVQTGGVISGGGLLTVNFLGNVVYNKSSTTTHYSTDDGYLIYGLPTPTGTLTLTGNSSTMASQTGTGTTPGGWEPNANYSNGTERNVPVQVVTGSSFTLSLNTVEANLQVTPTQTYHDKDADGNNAQFTIDGGTVTVAANGTTSATPAVTQLSGIGQVDTTTTDVSYGYEDFALSSPGYYNSNGNGSYSQTIDTANLSIGYHYIEAIAFRYNSNTSAPPVYNDWYETIYVDRGTPSSTIQSFAAFASAPTNNNNRQLDVQSDGTTNAEYTYLNLPVGITNTQILNMISTGNNTISGVTYTGGSAGQTDQNLFAYGFNNLYGNNVATVVSYRPDGNYSIQRFTADEVSELGLATTDGLGLGDLNADGKINTTDVEDFYEDVQSEGQKFSPAADMYGNGLNDPNDWLAFQAELQNDNLTSALSTFNSITAGVTVPVPAATSYNLMVPVTTATLGSLSLGSGSTLAVIGNGAANSAYTLTLGSTALSGSVTITASNNGTGPAVLNMAGISDSGNASAIQFGGTGTINLTAAGNLSAATTVTINTGTTVQVKGNSALGINGVAVTNNGAFVVDANQTIGNLSGPGTLTVGNGSTANTLQLATNSGNSTVSSLTINALAALDITNNSLTINYSGADPIATIRQYLINGYNGGAWNGPDGIDSSAANVSPGYAIGYSDGADGVVTGLLPGQILVAYTLYGDANLDGKVNGIDFNILATNFNQYAPNWDQGDFNYDGDVNGEDFVLMAENFNQSVGQASAISQQADSAALYAFASANGFLSELPEPASLAFLLIGFMGTLARRRRETGNGTGAFL